MTWVKQSYKSFKFWENIINENKTIRGHMFMDNPPKDKSLYIHTLIFSKKNGIDNIYAYFPDEKALLGYIQYSFLQEAFYKWIYGRDSILNTIPFFSVEKIIKDGLKSKKITNDIAKEMNKHNNKVSKMWDLPKERIVPELIKFAREFNKTWFGNNSEFLYLKVFKTPTELCDFVINSTLITASEENFEAKIGVKIDQWKTICKEAQSDEAYGNKFKEIMKRNLSEII